MSLTVNFCFLCYMRTLTESYFIMFSKYYFIFRIYKFCFQLFYSVTNRQIPPKDRCLSFILSRARQLNRNKQTRERGRERRRGRRRGGGGGEEMRERGEEEMRDAHSMSFSSYHVIKTL